MLTATLPTRPASRCMHTAFPLLKVAGSAHCGPAALAEGAGTTWYEPVTPLNLNNPILKHVHLYAPPAPSPSMPSIPLNISFVSLADQTSYQIRLQWAGVSIEPPVLDHTCQDVVGSSFHWAMQTGCFKHNWGQLSDRVWLRQSARLCAQINRSSQTEGRKALQGCVISDDFPPGELGSPNHRLCLHHGSRWVGLTGVGRMRHAASGSKSAANDG